MRDNNLSKEAKIILEAKIKLYVGTILNYGHWDTGIFSNLNSFIQNERSTQVCFTVTWDI